MSLNIKTINEEHWPVKKNWHSYLSAAKCIGFAYGPADVIAIQSSLASLKSIMSFWCQLTQVCFPGNEVIKRVLLSEELKTGFWL